MGLYNIIDYSAVRTGVKGGNVVKICRFNEIMQHSFYIIVYSGENISKIQYSQFLVYKIGVIIKNIE